MRKYFWLASACLPMLMGAPVAAQDTSETELGEIIVTATRRAQALADVPLAVSAISASALRDTGADDIRGLNQISPSLLVYSTTSEANSAVARIRGIGTVGDNPGLESSVGVFIDGVYRSRTGTALGDLGDLERVEVLRGPQGTLFGRNTSAGLINVVTAKPRFVNEGSAEFSYGNYDYRRGAVSLTGPFGQSETLAYKLDGLFVDRDGFMRDVVSDRSLNDRNRWSVRGQMLYVPHDDLDVRVIADFAKRNEECCGAVYLPARDVSRDASGGLRFTPSSVAALERSLGAIIIDDPKARKMAITPGRDYQSDVEDWGLSAEVNWTLGGVDLTAISAYRDWTYDRGQDADFNNLDIFYRDDYTQRFRTFSQELRLRGDAFDNRLDWLVGAYYAHEKLNLRDDLQYGADYDRFANALISARIPGFPGYGQLQGLAAASLAAQGVPTAAAAPIVALVPNISLANTGSLGDRFTQTSRNMALFTHNVVHITDRLSLTLGARYTRERKKLVADLASDNAGCAAMLGAIADLGALGAANAALAPAASAVAGNLQTLAQLPCATNPLNGSFQGRKTENKWSGTAVLGYKLTDDLLAYGSYAKGYKAGGFNLDRAALSINAPQVSQMMFAPETVDNYEIGVKYDGRRINLNLALFHAVFSNFQLNTFNGLNYVVETINGCKEALDVNGACTGNTRGGVTSRGVEVEAALFPADDVTVNLGFTYADTQYRQRLVGADGRTLTGALFQLPGAQMSNAPEYVITGGAGWTPQLTESGITGLVYADFRYQSDMNTGSDLDFEKRQGGTMIVNARLGVRGPENRWSLEFWAQNLFDVDYRQLAFDMPLQGTGSTNAVRQGMIAGSNTLYGAFMAEPRTYGMTVRTRF